MFFFKEDEEEKEGRLLGRRIRDIEVEGEGERERGGIVWKKFKAKEEQRRGI